MELYGLQLWKAINQITKKEPNDTAVVEFPLRTNKNQQQK